MATIPETDGSRERFLQPRELLQRVDFALRLDVVGGARGVRAHLHGVHAAQAALLAPQLLHHAGALVPDVLPHGAGYVVAAVAAMAVGAHDSDAVPPAHELVGHVARDGLHVLAVRGPPRRVEEHLVVRLPYRHEAPVAQAQAHVAPRGGLGHRRGHRGGPLRRHAAHHRVVGYRHVGDARAGEVGHREGVQLGHHARHGAVGERRPRAGQARPRRREPAARHRGGHGGVGPVRHPAQVRAERHGHGAEHRGADAPVGGDVALVGVGGVYAATARHTRPARPMRLSRPPSRAPPRGTRRGRTGGSRGRPSRRWPRRWRWRRAGRRRC